MRKFKAYMENNNRAFFVDKDVWLNDIMPNSGTAILIDLEPLPIKRMKRADGYIGALVRPSTQADYTIEVYREDKNDPEPINRYTWSVYENISNIASYQNVVNASSTQDDTALQKELQGHVLILPDPKDDLHWMLTLPSSVDIVINKK